ncbi:MAG: RnfABCDGE type electron transport complex subunit D [Luminiphilus sp.]
MSLLRVTSPHASGLKKVSQVMRDVLLATIPGILVMTWFFGPGTLINLILGGSVALAVEYGVMALRGRDPRVAISDLSVLVTATLLCIALPPYAPWWLIVIGVLTAVLLGKQVFGGLGYNPFNPAMVGYVVLLISFPVQMSSWAVPRELGAVPGIAEALQRVFLPGSIDALTGATPLDLLRQNTGLLFDDLMKTRPELSGWAGVGWFEVNLAFLAGGLWLLYRRVFTWHAPIAMLATLALCALMGFDGGSSQSGGSALFHLFSGASMFAAFFIITDPVSSAVSNRGRLIFGALIGLLVYLIRVLGNYPDAVAFAVLILNFCAPFIDHYTQPTVYGTRKQTP